MDEGLYYQQQLEEMMKIEEEMNRNHAKFVGVSRFIRDFGDAEAGINALMVVLKEYEELNRRLG